MCDKLIWFVDKKCFELKGEEDSVCNMKFRFV